jgi:hypothetical protein
MDLISKIKWISGVLLVFVIVLVTNLVDRDNFNRLRYAIVTIYEDRIVANDLIFEMSLLIKKKEIAVAVADSIFFRGENDKLDVALRDFIKRYERTRLTAKEQDIFKDFQEHLLMLNNAEKDFLDSNLANKEKVLNRLSQINEDLYGLSKIQLDEGRRQMGFSNRTMETIDLLTRIEIVFLVLMAVLVQIIILYKPK